MIAGIKKLILLALIAAGGWGIYYYFFHEEPTVYGLVTAQISRGNITSTVTATGELNAISVVEVGTQVSGIVKELYVDYNSVVKAGQLIALIDPSVQKLALSEAQANLVGMQASVSSAQASLKDAEAQYKRNQELLRRNLIARSTVDTSAADLEVRRAALKDARAKVEQGKVAVERAKTNLGYTRITSPVNGIVIDKKVEAGQTVASSYQTPTLFKIAQDLSKMKIETKVDEADIGTVKEGQNVTFRVDAFPDETFNGKVVQVRIAPTTTDNVVTYTVIIHVDNQELKLKPGMTANVSIETAKAENVLRIPVAALRFTPPEDLLKTISFDRNILTMRKTLNTGTLWPEHDGFMMRPIRVETGVTDGRFVELVKEISTGTRPPRPDGDTRPDRGPREILREGVNLVVNAQAGVTTGTTTRGGLLGQPRGPRPDGRGGPR
ncbi:MAG: efflux RND transporter periplasmic adaptor subunit [Synergistaceae bacterium]|nr:efflux RND transporter periplasmic adaptor subunit [Synergistaceae bacterium]